MQLVVVKFRDPTTFDYWAPMDEVDKVKCKICYAAGFLIETNDDVTKVALLCSQDKEDIRSWVVVPTGCVLTCDVIQTIDWEVPND